MIEHGFSAAGFRICQLLTPAWFIRMGFDRLVIDRSSSDGLND